jgi:uncharacterized protein
MIINVKRIPPDGEELEGEEPAAIMDWDDPDVLFKQDIKYRLTAQIEGKALLVTGTLGTPVTLCCSRCLKSFDQPLRVKQFVFHQELTGEDFVDLTANIREDIILELPQRALCRQDCRGLCPRCGRNLNEGNCQCGSSREDLRWHALDQLKLK